MKSISSSKPVLKQFAGLWTMSHQPQTAKEWSLEEKFKQAKKAGFDAMGGGANPEIVKLCEKYRMDYVCYIDTNGATFREKLQAAQETRPVRINVQLCDHDTPPAKAVKAWIKVHAAAEKMGLNVDLEVHRDTCTETPEKAYAIADLFEKQTGKKIGLCFDFSHIAVVKHLNPPFADRLLVRPDLIRLSRQVHFRPFNGHHCQIPATNGKGKPTPEFADYLQFLDAFLACWLTGTQGAEVLYACPEFGPMGGYGISTFPNVWKDAVLLREETEALWQKNLRRRKPR